MFTYKLDSNLAKSLFSKWTVPGTGHPEGFTNAFIKNNKKELIIDLEFTPDNTQDKRKDYAKVFIRQKNKLKEFKITEDFNLWGTVDFKRTEKIKYRHKIYHFRIPLKKIISGKEGLLELAFAAYGTAAPPPSSTGSGESGVSEFMFLYNETELKSQLIKDDRTFTSNPQTISANGDSVSEFSIASVKAENHLAVWSHSNSIKARFINSNGTPDSTTIILSTLNDDNKKPVIAGDLLNNQYFTVWENGDVDTERWNIYGKLLSSTGNSITSETQITSTFEARSPQIAYNQFNKNFIVTWRENNKIYSKFISANGSVDNNGFLITDTTNDTDTFRISADSRRGKYLAVWKYNSTIYGRFINSDKSTGNIITIATNVTGSPSIAYCYWLDLYLLAWRQPIGLDLNDFSINQGDAIGESGNIYRSYLLTSEATSDFSTAPVLVSGLTDANPTIINNSFNYNSLIGYFSRNDPTVSTTAKYPINELVYPLTNATNISTSPTLIFKINQASSGETVTYKIYLDTSNSFSNTTGIEVSISHKLCQYKLAGMSLLGVISLLILKFKFHRKKNLNLIFLLFVILILSLNACGSSSGSGDDLINSKRIPGSGELGYTFYNLKSNTTYYWKVESEYSSGTVSKSPTYNFKTE